MEVALAGVAVRGEQHATCQRVELTFISRQLE